MSEDLQSKATDFVKRILSVGVGTLFLTEESLKGLVGEFKIPKELIAGILESANRTRKEFLQNLASEMITKVTEKVEPQELVEEILKKHDIEFTIKVSFSEKKRD